MPVSARTLERRITNMAENWLSGIKVLERFAECFDTIKAFLIEKQQDYPELEDEKWLVKLMFLTDITGHLNKFNLRLQGAGQKVLLLFDAWMAFVAKFGNFLKPLFPVHGSISLLVCGFKLTT
eukprot:superscaffoldBa00000419_g4596